MRCGKCHKETGTISATTGLCNDCDAKYREKHKADIADAKKEIQDTIYAMIDATVENKKYAHAFKKVVLDSIPVGNDAAEKWIKSKEEFDNDTSKREKSKK